MRNVSVLSSLPNSPKKSRFINTKQYKQESAASFKQPKSTVKKLVFSARAASKPRNMQMKASLWSLLLRM